MVWAAAGDADFGTGDVVIARVYSRIEDYARETWRSGAPAWPACRFCLGMPGLRSLSASLPSFGQAPSNATICNKRMKCSMFRFWVNHATMHDDLMIDSGKNGLRKSARCCCGPDVGSEQRGVGSDIDRSRSHRSHHGLRRTGSCGGRLAAGHRRRDASDLPHRRQPWLHPWAEAVAVDGVALFRRCQPQPADRVGLRRLPRHHPRGRLADGRGAGWQGAAGPRPGSGGPPRHPAAPDAEGAGAAAPRPAERLRRHHRRAAGRRPVQAGRNADQPAARPAGKAPVRLTAGVF
ncbi:hypothetical protein COLO4_02021 [Corchorus olitorius]|uniref:Uncharacterized protein n=1 Tax=Corchorus olitorius TaxID=93759 RepID=A0A1R3L1K9_9ROSI|nr:hypothetical protein COLO4_02021 [Corchorus olitorius]